MDYYDDEYVSESGLSDICGICGKSMSPSALFICRCIFEFDDVFDDIDEEFGYQEGE